MPRVKGGMTSRSRKKKVFQRAKGYWGAKKNQWQLMTEQVRRSLKFATRDRRVRKRDFRALWIVRINAAAREHGISYSQFIQGLKLARILIDRKVLAELAVTDSQAFAAIATAAKQALSR